MGAPLSLPPQILASVDSVCLLGRGYRLAGGSHRGGEQGAGHGMEREIGREKEGATGTERELCFLSEVAGVTLRAATLAPQMAAEPTSLS